MKSYKYNIQGLSAPVKVGEYLRKDCCVSSRLIKSLKRLEDGIVLNGKRVKTVDLLQNGDVLVINLCDRQDEKVRNVCDIAVQILYEDADFVVFNKPPNMPTHTSFNHLNGTLENVFYKYCEKLGVNYKYRPINRLDKDTSGLVLVAKSGHSAHVVSKNVKKAYFLIAKGVIKGEGVIDKPIDRDVESIIKRKISPFGKRSITKYKTIKNFEGYSFMCAFLETGRTHQIRLHFSSINHPLIGDSLYGQTSSLIKRQALHCFEVEFFSLSKNSFVKVTSEIYEDMQNALNVIEKMN